MAGRLRAVWIEGVRRGGLLRLTVAATASVAITVAVAGPLAVQARRVPAPATTSAELDERASGTGKADAGLLSQPGDSINPSGNTGEPSRGGLDVAETSPSNGPGDGPADRGSGPLGAETKIVEGGSVQIGNATDKDSEAETSAGTPASTQGKQPTLAESTVDNVGSEDAGAVTSTTVPASSVPAPPSETVALAERDPLDADNPTPPEATPPPVTTTPPSTIEEPDPVTTSNPTSNPATPTTTMSSTVVAPSTTVTPAAPKLAPLRVIVAPATESVPLDGATVSGDLVVVPPPRTTGLEYVLDGGLLPSASPVVLRGDTLAIGRHVLVARIDGPQGLGPQVEAVFTIAAN